MQMRCSVCGSTSHNKTTHHRNLPPKDKSRGRGRPINIPNQDPTIAAEEAKVVARAGRKLAYGRAKAAAVAKKDALNASQPNATDIAGIGLGASKRQRT
ncbi:uncharacterized protein Pyn_27328 [Prunus yedoensis var. nudiflora]|uniref:Uncharacterized protein n=1 Tax=Prunus yedoensis var. nudiflora TaxID=2094558 RepID=A0A315AXN3_PRUYE|nr:uncharacterized protein Pyn_27328 [Prunus yedoensis var. nudiflora]